MHSKIPVGTCRYGWWSNALLIAALTASCHPPGNARRAQQPQEEGVHESPQSESQPTASQTPAPEASVSQGNASVGKCSRRRLILLQPLDSPGVRPARLVHQTTEEVIELAPDGLESRLYPDVCLHAYFVEDLPAGTYKYYDMASKSLVAYVKVSADQCDEFEPKDKQYDNTRRDPRALSQEVDELLNSTSIQGESIATKPFGEHVLLSAQRQIATCYVDDCAHEPGLPFHVQLSGKVGADRLLRELEVWPIGHLPGELWVSCAKEALQKLFSETELPQTSAGKDLSVVLGADPGECERLERWAKECADPNFEPESTRELLREIDEKGFAGWCRYETHRPTPPDTVQKTWNSCLLDTCPKKQGTTAAQAQYVACWEDQHMRCGGAM